MSNAEHSGWAARELKTRSQSVWPLARSIRNLQRKDPLRRAILVALPPLFGRPRRSIGEG
jgi:hypothetical protein